MAGRSVTRVLADAQSELAARSEVAVLEARKRRYAEPQKFLEILGDFLACQFWREGGFGSAAEWFRAALPKTKQREWAGWMALARLKLPDSVHYLIRKGILKVDRVAALERVITQENYRSMLWLAINLRYNQLEETALAYSRLRRSGYLDKAVFLPLWIPLAEYRKLVTERGEPGLDPVWEWLRGGA